MVHCASEHKLNKTSGCSTFLNEHIICRFTPRHTTGYASIATMDQNCMGMSSVTGRTALRHLPNRDIDPKLIGYKLGKRNLITGYQPY